MIQCLCTRELHIHGPVGHVVASGMEIGKFTTKSSLVRVIVILVAGGVTCESQHSLSQTSMNRNASVRWYSLHVFMVCILSYRAVVTGRQALKEL